MNNESKLHRKERIILTTIEIIDELGLLGLSTREIARRQGISEGTLFRHFTSKSQIILAMLDYFSQYDAELFHSVTLQDLTAKEAIVYVIESFVTYYERYPAITAVMQVYSVLLAETDFADKIKSIMCRRNDFLKRVIEEGKSAGEICANTDSALLADIIIATFERICLLWRVNARSFSLRNRVLEAENMLLALFCR